MQYLSKEKLKKLQEELEELKTTKRREIAERLRAAKELGDLSENAEYTEAREAQAEIERRIVEIENILRNSRVITKSRDRKKVTVGSTIEVKFGGIKQEFTLVGSEDSNPVEGLISDESPLGKAFLGREVGDKVIIQTPEGRKEYKIISIK